MFVSLTGGVVLFVEEKVTLQLFPLIKLSTDEVDALPDLHLSDIQSAEQYSIYSSTLLLNEYLK